MNIEFSKSPELTDAMVEAAARQQEADIEEQLLKMRLKQRCFVVLATLSPSSVVATLKEERGTADGDHARPTLVIQDEPKPFDPMNAFPKGRWTL